MHTEHDTAGPLLEELIEAQKNDERISTYPALSMFARALVEHCATLGNPVVTAVGATAERLVGAATVLSRGAIRARAWTSEPVDDVVLLVTATAVTPVSLCAAARHAREQGAREVHACGVRVHGIDGQKLPPGLDSYMALCVAESAPGRGDLDDRIARPVRLIARR